MRSCRRLLEDVVTTSSKEAVVTFISSSLKRLGDQNLDVFATSFERLCAGWVHTYIHTFYNYIHNGNNKSFFTELGKTYKRERYLNLKNFEIRKAIINLRFSSNKLTIVTEKWYKIKEENKILNFCNFNAIEDGFQFLKDFPNYRMLKESTTKSIQTTEHFVPSQGNVTKKLREMFSSGLL